MWIAIGIVVLFVLGFVVSHYYRPTFIELPLELDNGITLDWMTISNEELKLMKSIDKNVIWLVEWPIVISTLSSLVLDDNIVWYEYKDINNADNKLFVRAKWKAVWSLPNVKNIFCCPLYAIKNIDHYIVPTKILDIIRKQWEDYIILQWEDLWWVKDYESHMNIFISHE